MGPSESGSVVLDLGGDSGALIIYTGRELHGREIEISRVDDDGPRTHSAVRERHVRDGVFHSAVYPDLEAGLYTVWWDDSTPAGAISVTGGAVAEFVWPPSSPSTVS
ncbi:phospholipase [Micromonospora sp. PPF5-17]|uniref:Phospholipase n=1 Tax=Micromonospora solifontis TaxID=2487138 RepID=A0ABX9WL44_9ACTN|nr:phospholipase [Micromonospora sp. PPF5-17B]NES36505.1 phospholipase [Micromonospora solifontis]NES56351.1 phospholipase [Micromonospora sp. PPF5-6]RNL99446.1 phospholipase [Micromonospora solifontis]